MTAPSTPSRITGRFWRITFKGNLLPDLYFANKQRADDYIMLKIHAIFQPNGKIYFEDEQKRLLKYKNRYIEATDWIDAVVKKGKFKSKKVIFQH